MGPWWAVGARWSPREEAYGSRRWRERAEEQAREERRQWRATEGLSTRGGSTRDLSIARGVKGHSNPSSRRSLHAGRTLTASPVQEGGGRPTEARRGLTSARECAPRVERNRLREIRLGRRARDNDVIVLHRTTVGAPRHSGVHRAPRGGAAHHARCKSAHSRR